MQFEVHKRDPPQVAKFQAIIDKCTMLIHIFYVWVSAADNRCQPKQRKGKARVGREENTSENPKKTIRFLLLDQNCRKKYCRFPELTSF